LRKLMVNSLSSQSRGTTSNLPEIKDALPLL
jgi:hypothetical protein